MNAVELVIDRKTTIKALLDANQEQVIAVLVKLNKNFGKLRNPVLRKLLAKRVSIEDACSIAGCNVSAFLRTMQTIGFKLKEDDNEAVDERNQIFDLPAEDHIIEFDVRPILAVNKDPLKDILHKASQLQEGECLKIINSFEPIPLINLLRKKGYRSFSEILRPDLVITYFLKMMGENIEAEMPVNNFINTLGNFEETLLKYQGNVKTIDVTMLEMPLPMHTILEALPADKNSALFVNHKKVPIYLLPHLHDKGYEYLIREEEGGKISMLIYKI